MSATQAKLENPGGWGTPFSVVLFVLSLVIFLLVVISFVGGCILYFKGSFVDYQRHLLHSEDARWLLVLFLIPIVLQVAGLAAMFMRLHKDKSLTTHYAFCIIIMSACPLSYCSLWICYTVGWHSWANLSYVALVAIIFLLLPVVLMTYAIMWTPTRNPRKDAWQLKVEDITDWSRFCSELKTDGAAFGGYRRRIFERLPNDIRNEVMHATHRTEYESISKSALVDELNRILEDRNLHLAINLDNNEISLRARDLLIKGQKNLTNEEVKQLHRLLFNASFSGAIQSSEPVPGSKFKKWVRDSIDLWESFLLNIKEGITKAHFWVLTNFFAVFLGVTYLFGFAFAFQDQRSIEDNKSPDLYMSKTLPSRVGARQLEDPKTTENHTVSVPQYVFYFDSISAHPDVKRHPDFNDNPFLPDENSTNPNKDWKDGINFNQVERITDDILKLTGKGERLRVELVGSTDDCDLQAVPYSSNYELSEARAQNVKYILLKRLTEKDKKQLDIEWMHLPVSSEGSPLFPLAENRSKKVNCEEQLQAARASQKRKPDQAAESRLLTQLENQKSTLVMARQLSPDSVDLLNKRMDDLKGIVQNEHLTKDEEVEEPLGRLKSLASAIQESERPGLTNDERQELKKYVSRKKVELQESFDAFKYVDEKSRKRVVVVSLIPVQTSSWFIPLSLMDYMYFTIYTITTTGYGDIVPITPFAKFLCSSANILEVFFLVVFFNALLSVKGEHRLLRATDKK